MNKWRGGCTAMAAALVMVVAGCGGGGGSKNSTASDGSAAAAAEPVRLEYVSSIPQTLYLAGAGGTSRADVVFRLLDASGKPVANRQVSFRVLDTATGVRLEGAASDGTLVRTSDSAGEVVAPVLAGTVPAAVRIGASAGTLSATSFELRVAVGRPSQSGVSLAPAVLNIEGLSIDGAETELVVSLADRVGNPVPDGVQVNFVAESGVLIPPSCVTSGGTSRCSVKLRSQGVRPSDGRVSILAYTPGEEDFVDANGNNAWDAGESFSDLGQAMRDDNENGTYDSGEFFIARPGSVACAGSSPAGKDGPGRPNTCDGTWGTVDVRRQTVIVFSGSQARISALGSAPRDGAFDVLIADENNNNMPSGSAIAVTVRAVDGSACQAELGTATVPSQLKPTQLPVTLSKCAAGDVIDIKVTSPSGVARSASFAVN